MLILDTDHFSELLSDSGAGRRLANRLEADGRFIATTIIKLEEQARGWLARIRGARGAEKHVAGYAKLQRLFSVAHVWTILPWTMAAATAFDQLGTRILRIAAMDLRIAAIVVVHGGCRLSRNLKDFEKVSGIEVQDWLE